MATQPAVSPAFSAARWASISRSISSWLIMRVSSTSPGSSVGRATGPDEASIGEIVARRESPELGVPGRQFPLTRGVARARSAIYTGVHDDRRAARDPDRSPRAGADPRACPKRPGRRGVPVRAGAPAPADRPIHPLLLVGERSLHAARHLARAGREPGRPVRALVGAGVPGPGLQPVPRSGMGRAPSRDPVAGDGWAAGAECALPRVAPGARLRRRAARRVPQ